MNIIYSILAEYLMLPRNHGTYFGNQLITRKIILNLHANCDNILKGKRNTKFKETASLLLPKTVD